jgi:lipid-binding SYLF domain-containing protein
MDGMLSSSLKLGVDGTLTAGPKGAGMKIETTDIVAFSRSKGLYGGVSVEGAVISTRDNWNAAYYGKPVRPVDIIVKRSVSNKQADELRRLVSKMSGH